jgi:hypothetical protein
VNKGITLAVMLTVAATAAPMAQEPAPASSKVQVGPSVDVEKRRGQIRMLEGVFSQAVRNGASEVAAKLRKLEPAGMMMQFYLGTPRARGFILEGYGVFFDIEIPALNQSVAWSVLTIQRDRQVLTALDALSTALASMPAGPTRQQAQQAFQHVAQTVGPPQRTDQSQPAPGAVQAADAAPRATATIQLDALYDPLADYTEAVKNALVDAMLDHSLRIELGPEDWLTVAARESEGPLPPGGISDSMTIVLRVQGAELATYQADRTKRDEIRAKVRSAAKVF